MSVLSQGLTTKARQGLAKGEKLIILGGRATALAPELKADGRVELWQNVGRDADLDSAALVVCLDSSDVSSRARLVALCEEDGIQCIKAPQPQGAIIRLVEDVPVAAGGAHSDVTQNEQRRNVASIVRDAPDARKASGLPLADRLAAQLEILAETCTKMSDLMPDAKRLLDAGSRLQNENERLKAENEKLKADISQLEARVAGLERHKRELESRVSQISEIVSGTRKS